MNQEIYSYLQRMHSFIQSQERRILELEKTIRELSKELQNIKSRPPVHVGTIEYKFDQLKVETLDGTLNIGLNPSDLEGIDEFSVQNKGIIPKLSPKQIMQRSMELEESIRHYLENDLEALIKDYEEQLGMEIEDSYVEFIRDDIKKQLPQRIDYYLKQVPNKEGSPEVNQKVIEQIEEQMKRDIANAVLTFMRNSPNIRKEDK